VIETRLRHSYALLTQAVRKAEADYGDPSGWDFTSTTFKETYIMPYIKSEILSTKTSKILLANGTTWEISRYHYGEVYLWSITIDINGTSKPNERGKDIFAFFIFPAKNRYYNTGVGNCAYNVPRAGIYYDGYGFSDSSLRTYSWRGCDGSKEISGYNKNAFCLALIVKNNWKIPKDYPLKI
jgi:hypothetical protein